MYILLEKTRSIIKFFLYFNISKVIILGQGSQIFLKKKLIFIKLKIFLTLLL